MSVTIDFHDAGVERLNILSTAASQEEFKEKWQPAREEYPFVWGDCWKATMTFRVPDFPAEFSFFYDVLGFVLFAHWENHVMIASPDREYIISLGQAEEGVAFDPSCFQLDLMLDNIGEVSAKLKERGIALDADVQVEGPPDSPMRITTFHTPNGILVKLWGMVNTEPEDGV